MRRPLRWDLQAERYSAAITLYEMTTGVLPRWGDGPSDPVLRTGAARATNRGTLEAEQAASSPRFHMRRALTTSIPGSGTGEQPPIGAGHAAQAQAPGADGPLLVRLSHELIAYAETLAWAADRFTVAEPLVPPHRVLHDLREISAPPGPRGCPRTACSAWSLRRAASPPSRADRSSTHGEWMRGARSSSPTARSWERWSWSICATTPCAPPTSRTVGMALHGVWALLACDDREELPMLDGEGVPHAHTRL